MPIRSELLSRAYKAADRYNGRTSTPLTITRNTVRAEPLNHSAEFPYELRLKDFELALQDVYDFFVGVNGHPTAKGLRRLDDMLLPQSCRRAIGHANGQSCQARKSAYAEQLLQRPSRSRSARHLSCQLRKSRTKGIAIKANRNRGGAVDTHGTRYQWMGVFVYGIDTKTELAIDRAPMTFTEIYLGRVTAEDFRKNPRAELGENGKFEGWY
jgi:hypothetical protein